MIEQITLKVVRNVLKLSAGNGKQLKVIFLILQVTIATHILHILTAHESYVAIALVTNYDIDSCIDHTRYEET